MDTPLIKLHTMADPDPTPTPLTPEELAQETNPEEDTHETLSANAQPLPSPE